MLNFTLSEERQQLRDKAREFARQYVLPVAWHYDEKDETPVSVLKKAHELGMMSGDIPERYGGRGHGLIDGVLAIEEIAAACPGIATSVFDNSLGMAPVILGDNEEVREKYLTTMAGEFKMMCFGTSEPTMGSDVSSINCHAEPDGDEYVLTGTKYWITNGGLADYFTLFATTDPKQAHKGIGCFVVETGWDGVTVGKRIPKLGQRCSNTVGIHLDHVRVPRENVVAPPGEGFVLAMKTFARTRPAIAAFAVGAARSAMEYALDWTKKRRAFGQKIANFQAIQFKLADMYQKVETARLLTWKCAWEADNGIDPNINASIAKLYASEKALEVANEALQIFGGYGYTKMYPVEKLLRDTRLFSIYEGTSEVQRLVLGGYVMGQYEPAMPPLDEIPMHTGDVSGDGEPGKKAWRCRMCGHVHYGDEAPEQCPYCFFPTGAFVGI
ncbi:MAG: acyl-CoA dehydrogenase family protein [Desulfatibacillaceae bacterium]